MDQLQAMRCFMRVAELGSFTRAAEVLGLSRSMVSTQVRRLERHLGPRLLNRTTRQVGLTAAGSEYLQHCERVFRELREAEDALRRAQEQPAGRLRVDVPGAFGRHLLLPALPGFLARYPAIELELRLNDRVVDLVAEGVDLAVRGGTVSDPGLVARRVAGSNWITCAAPEYLARQGWPRSIADLSGHALLGTIPPGAGQPRAWHFADEAAGWQPPPFRTCFNEAEAALLAAVHGAGIMQTIDLLAARRLENRELVLLLPEQSLRGPPVSLVYPPASRQLARVRVFAEFLQGLLTDLRQRCAAATGLPSGD